MRKFEIARILASRCSYTSYLEVCTPTTGTTYAQIDKRQFTRRVRLMYRCPPGFADGEPIDYSTAAESGEALFAELMRTGERFDLVFIDPFHTYESSLRDLAFGLQLVKKNGAVFVHDCNPPHPGCAGPDFRPGEWCGVTFAAFLDVVLFAEDLHYATVDSDYGCGIISKHPQLAALLSTCLDGGLASRWRKLDLEDKYAFLDEHRSKLLRLNPVDELCLRLADGPQRRSKRPLPALQWTWALDRIRSRARQWLSRSALRNVMRRGTTPGAPADCTNSVAMTE